MTDDAVARKGVIYLRRVPGLSQAGVLAVTDTDHELVLNM